MGTRWDLDFPEANRSIRTRASWRACRKGWVIDSVEKGLGDLLHEDVEVFLQEADDGVDGVGIRRSLSRFIQRLTACDHRLSRNEKAMARTYRLKSSRPVVMNRERLTSGHSQQFVASVSPLR